MLISFLQCIYSNAEFNSVAAVLIPSKLFSCQSMFFFSFHSKFDFFPPARSSLIPALISLSSSYIYFIEFVLSWIVFKAQSNCTIKFISGTRSKLFFQNYALPCLLSVMFSPFYNTHSYFIGSKFDFFFPIYSSFNLERSSPTRFSYKLHMYVCCCCFTWFPSLST